MNQTQQKPKNLRDLRASGWKSKTVKQELHDNFLRMLREGEELFPGIVGYDNTVIPEINVANVTQNATAVGIGGSATAVNSSVLLQDA